MYCKRYIRRNEEYRKKSEDNEPTNHSADCMFLVLKGTQLRIHTSIETWRYKSCLRAETRFEWVILSSFAYPYNMESGEGQRSDPSSTFGTAIWQTICEDKKQGNCIALPSAILRYWARALTLVLSGYLVRDSVPFMAS